MTGLALKGGRVIDKSQGIDRIADMSFARGMVAAIGDNLAGPARDVTQASSSPPA